MMAFHKDSDALLQKMFPASETVVSMAQWLQVDWYIGEIAQ